MLDAEQMEVADAMMRAGFFDAAMTLAERWLDYRPHERAAILSAWRRYNG